MAKDFEAELSIFCANVSILRKQYNLTQKEMAAIMGVGVRTIRTLEAGIVPPRFGCDSLLRLSDHFHVLPSFFLTPMEP